MEFDLRKIKYFDEMSEETPCFTAQIWENGKHVADVKNDGHGGGNMVYGVNGLKYKDIAKFDNMDVEADIFGRVWEDYDIRRLQGKGLVLKKDGQVKGTVKFPIAISKFKKHPQFRSWIEKTTANMVKDGYEVVNRNL